MNYDPLADLKKEADDLDEYVKDFEFKMNQILSGQFDLDLDQDQDQDPKTYLKNMDKNLIKVSNDCNISSSEFNANSNPSSSSGPSDTTEKNQINMALLKKIAHDKNLSEESRISGNQAFKNQEFSAAIECYTNAINLSHQDLPTLFCNRALCKMKMFDFSGALDDCQHALQDSNNNNVKIIYRKSQCLRSMRQYQNAIECLQKCIKLAESDPEAQKVVSLAVLKEKLKIVLLLESDFQKEDIKLDFEAEAFLKDVIATLSRPCPLPAFKLKAFLLLLATDKKAADWFRLNGGFESLECLLPSREWALIIRAVTHENEKNARQVVEALSQFKFKLETLLGGLGSAAEKTEVAGVIVEIIVKSKEVTTAVEKDMTQSFGNLVEICLSAKDSFNPFLAQWLIDIGQAKKYHLLTSNLFVSLDYIFTHVLLHFSTFTSLAISFIFHLTLSDDAKIIGSLSSRADQLVDLLCSVADSETKPTIVQDCLSIIHNLILKTGAELLKLESVLRLTRVCSRLIQQYQHALKILAKLSSSGRVNAAALEVIKMDIDWNACMYSFPDYDQNDLGDWTQLFAAVLKSHSDQRSNFRHALPLLIALLNSAKTKSLKLQRAIGNAALCLSELVNDESLLNEAINLDGMNLLIQHLRLAKEKTVQRNLAICIGKLCKNSKGLQEARNMQALGLIACLKLSL